MPNWNYNSVTIHAPLADVKPYLVSTHDEVYGFNMPRLFPDRFPTSDATGDAHWDYDWATDNTGSKWFPSEIEVNGGDGSAMTFLMYDTARAPNNGTLQRLHELTGWTIENEYEEPGMCFEGTFLCRAGTCHDDEREYRPVCETCGDKYDRPEDDESEEYICPACCDKANRVS